MDYAKRLINTLIDHFPVNLIFIAKNFSQISLPPQRLIIITAVSNPFRKL